MNTIIEVLTGIVSRVTYHNPATGWSVLRVQPFQAPQQQETVTVHQTKVFAGATMEFRGAWTLDHKYGRQFKALKRLKKNQLQQRLLKSIWVQGSLKVWDPKLQRRLLNISKKKHWIFLRVISNG